VRENLLALSVNIWSGVDLEDLTSVGEGVRFMGPFTEKRIAFDQLPADVECNLSANGIVT
jgi:hypothetical protein